eukprot:scaffold2682_cov344-Pavlova_lutheri.AAC.20
MPRTSPPAFLPRPSHRLYSLRITPSSNVDSGILSDAFPPSPSPSRRLWHAWSWVSPLCEPPPPVLGPRPPEKKLPVRFLRGRLGLFPSLLDRVRFLFVPVSIRFGSGNEPVGPSFPPSFRGSLARLDHFAFRIGGRTLDTCGSSKVLVSVGSVQTVPLDHGRVGGRTDVGRAGEKRRETVLLHLGDMDRRKTGMAVRRRTDSNVERRGDGERPES